MTDSPRGALDPEDMEKLLNRYQEELSRLDLEPAAPHAPPAGAPVSVPAAGAPREPAGGAAAALETGSPQPLLSDFRERIRAETRALREKPEVPSVEAPSEAQGSAGGPSPEPASAAGSLLQGLMRSTGSTLKAMTSARRRAEDAGAAGNAAIDEKIRVLAERQSLLQRANEDLRSQFGSLADKFRRLRDITQSLIEATRNRPSG